MKTIHIKQVKKGYRYNTYSLILYDFARSLQPKNELLDIGCGCGIVGILLKNEFKDVRLHLLDIDKANCELARYNLSQNDLEAEVLCKDFTCFKSEKKFDFLVCNPPFYRQGALKTSNLQENQSKFQEFLPFDALLSSVNLIIKPLGRFVFCYEATALDMLCMSLREKKFKIVKMQFVHSDTHKKAKLVLIEARKGVKSMCEILPPFFVLKEGIKSKMMRELEERLNIISDD
ncbi:tRNA1(Val) (adenine(37)-N6)-methyltransferase [Campylobacter sp. MIT 99-7217]|uniref:tRNA1(Val) (adenine(37)-N6)-methyltransferase n=1 Tax=Campylobacter sp. MIT 99-7217 TaxID=535091 RepID=UPI0021AE45D0|nr:methyltransferase [Campylobacter sp. MIT 99-7217]